MISVSPVMIKHLPNIALEIFVNFFNAIFRVEYYPKSWQMSQIILIPKPAKNLTFLFSYPSIRLLTCLFEIVLQKEMNCCLDSENTCTIQAIR